MDDEYFSRYSELQAYMQHAYANVFLLQTIAQFEEDIVKMPTSTFKAIKHLSVLIKHDLALTIWKIYFDDDSKANTIKRLGGYIAKNYQEVASERLLPKMGLPNDLQETERQLVELRNNFLAHNDGEKKRISVNVIKLVRMLDTLKDKLNALCFPHIDKRAFVIKEEDIQGIEINMSHGFGRMIGGIAVDSENKLGK